MRDNLNVDEKEQSRKYVKKGKKAVYGNLYDEHKEHLKKENKRSKRKK